MPTAPEFASAVAFRNRPDTNKRADPSENDSGKENPMKAARSWLQPTGVARVFFLTLSIGVLTASIASAQPGGTITNGTNSADPGLIVPGFLFEPEFPLASLKTLPTWNELEQLLDNPYRVRLCASLPLSVDPLVRGTPGTTQITGSPIAPTYPSYCTYGVTRRPGFGVTLSPLLVHPLNYNPATGEEMRLLNPLFPETLFGIPDELVQSDTDPNHWDWSYKDVMVSAGDPRVGDTAIDYNGPIAPDGPPWPCIVGTEPIPPEGSTVCGGDPGEPNYAGFGVYSADAYSTPGVPGGTLSGLTVADITGLKLYDPFRGEISPRNGMGVGGLRKPSLKLAEFGGDSMHPNYLHNIYPTAVAPSNENDYVKDRDAAIRLGKSLFWDMQVGSDGVQSCGTCHFHAGADNRTKNQVNPNTLGGDLTFQVKQPNQDVVRTDFPLHQLFLPDVAGDPACTTPIIATVAGGILENNPPFPAVGNANSGVVMRVCDRANIVRSRNDVLSSMGVKFGRFQDIPPIGSFSTNAALVNAVLPDLRSAIAADNLDPVPGFAGADGSVNRMLASRGLSAREIEVARLLALGHTNIEIAASLYLSARTIEHHRANVFRKLGVHSRAALVHKMNGRPAPEAD